MANAQARSPLTGGCLCGEVQYTMNFPQGSQWPPDPHACQCTQCRKNTGALIVPFITLHPSQIEWNRPRTDPSSKFKEYNSTPGCYRGFCRECGSTLSWRSDSTPNEIEIMVGSIDENWLIGDRSKLTSEEIGNAGAWKLLLEDEERSGVRQLGIDLCKPTGGQLWMRNAIGGVTDGQDGGKKYVEASGLGATIQ